MTRRQILHLVFWGALLLFLGMLTGYVYRFAITDDWDPGRQRTMRILHLFMVQMGAFYIAIGAAGRYLTLGARAGNFAVLSLVVGGYAFALGLVVATIIDIRGLEPGDSVLSAIVYGNFFISSAAGAAGVGVIALGAFASLRRGTATDPPT